MAPPSTTCAISANCAPSGRVRGAVETCLAGAGTFDERSDTCRSLLGDWRRKTGLAKGLGVRNADQTDITAALTQGVDPALNQRSANAVIDDIERSEIGRASCRERV